MADTAVETFEDETVAAAEAAVDDAIRTAGGEPRDADIVASSSSI